ncbi:hypothetical protein JKP88DRAFT_272883 [Tribonema minus]|uniref:Uncharacterized protein n=1 Tax=Tribonema minus TaxID=303371 RepID=A0A835Z0S2_9STRA|nr:hypothetical protein JKP88DRAFT_272883 [Tribonema minus]
MRSLSAMTSFVTQAHDAITEAQTELLRCKPDSDERVRAKALQAAWYLIRAAQQHAVENAHAREVEVSLAQLQFDGLTLEEFAARRDWDTRIMVCRGEPDIYDERRIGVVNDFLVSAAELVSQLVYWS